MATQKTGADVPAQEVKAVTDAAEAALLFSEISEQAQRLIGEFASRQEGGPMGSPDTAGIARAFLEMTANLMANPAKIVEAQLALWHQYVQLWHNAARRLLGETPEPMVKPEKGDYRFRDKAWEENLLFDFLKQSYLLTSRWVTDTVHKADEGLDKHTARKVEFYTQQFVDALAPSNFVLTNPLVLRETIESRGDNLIRGLKNLLHDLENGKGQLKISQVDKSAFKVGGNIAITPGKVVFQTPLMQLIQYTPTTETVHKRPLLIIPPWINKYYILDLRPQNSLVKWLTDQGHTVFIISWVNPDAELARKGFEEYMREGPLAAIDAIEQATGENKVNIIGYCLGGTLLAITLAYMAAKKMDRIEAAAFFTSFVDFSETGEMSVFIDEDQLTNLEERMNERGYLEGSEMATTFNMLRSNDLIWSFVINNYLLGKEPFPFDLLYWNSDSTRMPAAMHSFYLRNMYSKNLLSKPGGIVIGDVPIDVRRIDVPTFLLATREDHIVPWRTAYRSTQLFSGPLMFTLAASGHIAGVANPPAGKKYSHWRNPKLPIDPEEWLRDAVEHPGSWWPLYQEWIAPFAGEQVPARHPGDGKLVPIEDAPGSYVLEQAE